MAEIHVNMKQLNKWKVYSDNVIAYDQIIQSKGKFFTDRPEIYTRWLDEFGIFYTLKGAEKEILKSARKSNPAKRVPKKAPSARMMAPFTIVKKAVEKLIRSRVETDYLGSWAGGELEVFIKREYATAENSRGQTKAYVKAILNDQDTRYKLTTQFAFADLNGAIFDMPKPKANPAPGHKAPSKRLKARRKLALVAPKGYFPNPLEAGISSGKAEQTKFPFHVQYRGSQTGKWNSIAAFEYREDAFTYAKKLARDEPGFTLRVMKDE